MLTHQFVLRVFSRLSSWWCDGSNCACVWCAGQFSLEYEAARRQKISKRAAVLRGETEAKRHKTVAMPDRDQSKKAKQRPPPGTMDRIRRLVGLRAPIHNASKKAGGLQCVPSKPSPFL
jgi:hypothetical protein